jgi:hypothetical protein
MGNAARFSMVAAAALGAAQAMGCLLIYDYDGFEKETGSGSCDVTQEPAAGCHACVNAQCAMELQDCGNTATCQNWGECFTACCGPSCFEGCDDEFPNNLKGDVVRQCACDRCDTECAGVTPACTN